jgi:hypothetical protein
MKQEVEVIDNIGNIEVMRGGHKAAVEVLKQAFINDCNKRLRGV